MSPHSKELIQYGTASLMVVSGVILSFISFFVNGDVTEGVLWYMAQALTFAGGVFGISTYFKTKLGESENRLREFLNEQLSKESEKNTPPLQN